MEHIFLRLDEGRGGILKGLENSIKSELNQEFAVLKGENKKAAPKIGAAFRFYPHHFKTGNRAVT
ncbi:hypothetical protein [Spirosoma jeollabukense]